MKFLLIFASCFLFVGIIIGLVHKPKPPLTETDVETQVDHLGKMLADWGNNHQQIIRINGKPINYIGSTIWAYTDSGCFGTNIVKWPSAGEDGATGKEVRGNLRKLIEESSCSSALVWQYPYKLATELRELNAEELAQDVNCLGEFEFISVARE